MRSLLTVVGMLCLVGTTSEANAQHSAADFRASEHLILECIASAEKEQLRTGTEATRRCIGQETRRCVDTTDLDSRAHQAMYCASAEGQAWAAILDREYASLRRQAAKWDEAAAKLPFNPPLEAALPLLGEAHQAWLAGEADCAFAAAQVGPGTDRIIQPARCQRDRTAERALLYRRGFVY
ncbi:lysozyme inhibitor LprI family protein [Reyranella soli]|uniref:Lysozyme inhibitor LprI-like N-terminal domain-containing protein n=1 Tax=Reyranella soli TaxID=1230389 RepID=A0A512NJX0_9HYPH|nr:lysozyme inhibitor LprI family protein [Reyranella soli]GEP59222.1 hypothetical protein RSO01_63880 [Reyranella soli]